MKVILVDNLLSGGIVGIYSTLEKAKMATIKEEQKFLEDNTMPKVVVDDIKEEIES